ncbi:glycosyltransferase [bacterium]|nr:glycosyltransferase [bacterium]
MPIETVAYIHTQPFGTREAGSAFVANTARGIAEAGAKCVLIVPKGDDVDLHVLAWLGLAGHPGLSMRHPLATRLEIGPFRPSWGAPWRKRASKIAERSHAGAVICRDLKVAARLVRDRYPGLVVYEMHNVYGFSEDARDQAFFPAAKIARHRRRVPLEKYVVERADGVITLTQGLADLLQKTRPVSGRVLAAGTAARALADPEGSHSRRDIAYVGALDAHKGVISIIRALARMPGDTRLKIFGQGERVAPLAEAARNLGVGSRVIFEGFVPPGELPERLASCRVGAVPFVDVFFNRYVSSPMKVFDYLAAGVIPVVPDLPVFREIFADESAAIFFPAGDEDALVAGLIASFDDDAMFRRKHLAALHQATTYTWKTRGERILAFLADLPFRESRRPRKW